MSARILVVDDILPNVKLLEAKLLGEYYDVVTASSGAEALEKVKETRPDIILLDVMMPEMDGFEVCRRLKADSDTAHIPVVMVTALTESADRVSGLEAGADDFLTKPVNDTALMARVRSLIRLKMTVDEWRARESTATSLGVVAEKEEADASIPARILLIEDQEFESTKFVETIESMGHQAVLVTTGAEALAKINQEDFDVVMVSLELEEDGLRFISHLRSNDKTRSIPILMIAQNDIQKIARGLEIGAHDYAVRPVDRNELKARLKSQIKRKRFQDKLKSNYEMSLSMALTDTLTGLFNRRYLNVHLEKLLKEKSEQKKPVAILMLDIDHFKSVNDTHGHQVGDEVLQIFSQRLKERVRDFDIIARTGGEEFVAILVDVTMDRACHIAERLRRGIAKQPFQVSSEAGSLSVTTSIGGIFIQEEDITVEDTLARADKFLYKAKETGRNRVIFEGKGTLNPEDYEEKGRPAIDD